ncbi:AAA family ATPase [Nocardia sp. NPDC049707]|uniref:ATP-binding protein n=1 Tax=Nocardia sp. NPDC049707 TaxID=3154735 RepID=UPI00343BEBF1
MIAFDGRTVRGARDGPGACYGRPESHSPERLFGTYSLLERCPGVGSSTRPSSRRQPTIASPGGNMDTSVHDTLSKMWEKGAFEPAISHIRFPLFRNLSTNLRINFSHPVTALIGPNGANKSAILRALQGCPRGNDPGNYWFGTAVDVIPQTERHRFIYGRLSPTTGGIVEVIKTRIGRLRDSKDGPVADPDLFEPSRPLTREPDSMDRFPLDLPKKPGDASRTRWATISKDVLYLDFRSQLSAFDWAMNHSEVTFEIGTQHEELNLVRARKKRIRSRAARLYKAISDGLERDTWYSSNERIVQPIHELTEDERFWVERILGRKYARIRLLRHRYFGTKVSGWTVILETPELLYSEAFAGSGEFAAVLLVYQVSRAKPQSLILLDEPEVSLHPRAQRALSNFLADSAKHHKHQIVFSTHSPEMIRELPAAAVKVLTVRADDGRVDLPVQDSPPQFAFDVIGAEYEHPTIVVEDLLAKDLVEYALAEHPSKTTVQVKYLPGGADTLWGFYAPMWAHEKRTDILLLLDGDQAIESPRPVGQIPPGELESELAKTFPCKPNLPYSRTDTASAQHRLESVKQVLEWRRRFVRFLPCWTPEVFLWDYRGQDPAADVTASADANGKNAWRDYTEIQTGASNAEQIHTFQLQALRHVPSDCAILTDIRDTVYEFIRSL